MLIGKVEKEKDELRVSNSQLKSHVNDLKISKNFYTDRDLYLL